jgi:hypothetical protein
MDEFSMEQRSLSDFVPTRFDSELLMLHVGYEFRDEANPYTQESGDA